MIDRQTELSLGAMPVTGFPAYLVRPNGDVLSFHHRAGIVMKPRPHKGGYKLVTICDGQGHQVTTTIHRLVAKTFISNPDDLPLVRHLDGNGANNAVSNLAWGTYEDNEADKISIGRRKYGTAKMKLNGSARAEVQKLATEGLNNREIADRFGVNASTISRLLGGRTWTNRKWPMADKAAAR